MQGPAAGQEHYGGPAAALQAPAAAGQERYGGPAAAVVAPILERYRGLEAAVAASGSVARPVTEAQGVAEAGSEAVAAICGVDRSVAAPPKPAKNATPTLLQIDINK